MEAEALEVQIAQINKKIDKLEYEEMASLKEKNQELEIALAKNSLLTETNTKAMEKMSTTMEQVCSTMIQLSHGVEQSNKVIEKLSTKVDNLETKFDAIDEKSKFDILSYLKNHWISIITSGAVIGYIFKNIL